MELIPNIRTAKPIMMSPTCRSVCFFENIRNRIPTSATDAVRVAVENMLAMPLPPPTVLRQMIQPVIDVPRIAPRMTLTACRTFIIPELTNPTVITDVAQDDWMTAVTPVPRSTARKGVLDKRYKTSSSLLPATFFSPSPISVMPKRKSATPPTRVIISRKLNFPRFPIHHESFSLFPSQYTPLGLNPSRAAC